MIDVDLLEPLRSKLSYDTYPDIAAAYAAILQMDMSLRILKSCDISIPFLQTLSSCINMIREDLLSAKFDVF